MRTYTQIYKDYCAWLVKTTGNLDYEYETFISSRDKTTAKSLLFKSIMELCYDPDKGLYFFCKFIIGDLQEIGYPKPFSFNHLFRKWDKLVKKHKHLAILCARGHGKSVAFSQVLNIYDMFLFPHRRIIIESASQEQAEALLEEIKRIIDNNEWLSSKKNPDMWRAGKLGFNGGYILGKGFGSEILGQHVDRIVVDDILRSDNKLTDEEIEDFIDMTLEPMLLNRKGQMIIVGTPRRETDIFATIFDRVRQDPRCPWFIKRFPAVTDYEKKILLCPDRFTWNEIMSKRLIMGPLKFAREYQLEFFSRDTSLFPDRITKPAKDKGKDMRLLFKADKRDPNWLFVTGVDVARSGSVSADYSVAITLAYNSVTQAKQIVNVWRSKGFKIVDQAEQIAQISRDFNNCMVLVEQNNMGQDMIDSLVDDFNVFVESFVTGGKGQKKEELIRYLIKAFEHEQIIIPCGDTYSRREMLIVESELAKFCVTRTPNNNEKFEGVGSHDDCVIALALANKATQVVGVPFAVNFGSRRPDLFETFVNNAKGESDLVKKIRMGIIK